jgi:hypothetical protein
MPGLTFDYHPDDLPETYVMTGDGRCLEPEIMDGTKLLFSRVEPYKPGDFVAIFKRREFTAPGEHQILVKKLVFAPGPRFWSKPDEYEKGNIAPVVIARMLNPDRALSFDTSTLLGIHKCLGPLPKGMRTHKISDDEVRMQAQVRNRETVRA